MEHLKFLLLMPLLQLQQMVEMVEMAAHRFFVEEALECLRDLRVVPGDLAAEVPDEVLGELLLQSKTEGVVAD